MRRRMQQMLFDCSVTLLVILSILWIWSAFGRLTGTRDHHIVAPSNQFPVGLYVERVDSCGFAIGDGRLLLTRVTQTWANRARTPRIAGDEVRWYWTTSGKSYWEGPIWWQRIGFIFRSQTRPLPSLAVLTIYPPDRSLAVGIPFWFLLILAALLAIPRLTRRVERDRRFAAGCCMRCGYDLRATPEKCPECGAVPSRAP
jgi:hypothetical protein